MKKALLLAAICLMSSLAKAQCSAQIYASTVSFDSTSRQITFGAYGINGDENASIWISWRIVHPQGDFTPSMWNNENPVNVPISCTGWIYGLQKPIGLLRPGDRYEVIGYMMDNSVLYSTDTMVFQTRGGRIPHLSDNWPVSHRLSSLTFGNTSGGFVVLNSESLTFDVQIYTINGQLVMSEKVIGSNYNYDSGTISSGMYIVKMSDADGDIRTEKCIIK